MVDVADHRRPPEERGPLARDLGNHCQHVVQMLHRTEAQPILRPLDERVRIADVGTGPAEQVYTETFQQGPTVQPVSFNVSSFSSPYQSGHDYTLLAFFWMNMGVLAEVSTGTSKTFELLAAVIVNGPL